MKKLNSRIDALPSKQKKVRFALYGLLSCVLLFLMAAVQTNYVNPDAPQSNNQGAIFFFIISILGMLLFLSSIIEIRKEKDPEGV